MTHPKDPKPLSHHAAQRSPAATLAAHLRACRMLEPIPLPLDAVRVHPLVAPTTTPRDHVLLSEVIGRGVTVRELSSASVPELLLHNRTSHKVLGLEGEVLVGCRQNRTLNTAVMVPPLAELRLPVSCVERGRWSHRTDHMGQSGAVLPSSVRRQLKRSVSDSLAMHRGHTSNQGAIWDSVANVSQSWGVRSATSDLSDAVRARSRREDVRELAHLLVAGFENACGYAVCVDDEWSAIELLGHRDDFNRMREHFARALASEIAGHRAGQRSRATWLRGSPLEHVAQAVEQRGREEAAIGFGVELRVASRRPRMDVSALVEQDAVRVVSVTL